MRELRALTADELERAKKRLMHPAPGSRIEAARDYGVDLTLLFEQLRLSPAERVEQMMELCQQAEELRGLARRNRR